MAWASIAISFLICHVFTTTRTHGWLLFNSFTSISRHFFARMFVRYCQACTVAWGYSVSGAGFAFVFELHEISVNSILQPVLSLLRSSLSLQCIDNSWRFGITYCGSLALSSRLLVRTVSSISSSIELGEMPLVTSHSLLPPQALQFNQFAPIFKITHPAYVCPVWL